MRPMTAIGELSAGAGDAGRGAARGLQEREHDVRRRRRRRRGPANGDPNDLLSDFAQDRAIVVPLGDPVRNGIWYSYNDGTCRQTPAHGEAYYPSTPAVLPPGFSGGRALHASWSQCTGWGAGVGADFAVPVGADSAAVGPRTPYSLQPYAGVAFWAMAAPGHQHAACA